MPTECNLDGVFRFYGLFGRMTVSDGSFVKRESIIFFEMKYVTR